MKIPYAIANYEEIINENYFIVDKTSFIAELEPYKVPVFLRPRRFGKTLMCSIQECYYDIKRKDEFHKLFGKTFIGKNPTVEKNKYLVLRLNFSVVKVESDYNELEYNFDYICSSKIKQFISYYKNYFKDFDLNEKEKTSNKIRKILDFIKENNLPKLYLVIDEYDNFSNQLILSQKDTMYEDLTTGDSFFRTFFKVIKAGTEEQTIRRCYITGVLPITIDDLTSGFNIAEVITLKPQFNNMLGFTQEELNDYLLQVFHDLNLDKDNFEIIKDLLKSYYNGYSFGLGKEKLYNSAIVSFFLKDFVMNNGKIPIDFIDFNLKSDINWIRRLTLKKENTKEMLEQLIYHDQLQYDYDMIRSKFNMNQFFEKDFYPVSLFYLGMLTFETDFTMKIPNQTMKKIFTEYFNIIEDFEVSKGYTPYFRQFLIDQDLEKLFAGYWKTYVGQIPAQAFDKVNENFFRTTFYEICTRYLSRKFVFNIEVNYPSGRSDWELLGKYHTEYKNLKYLAEFKHFSQTDARKKKIKTISEPFVEDIDQINGYTKDLKKKYPEYNISKFIIYTVSAKYFRFFRIK